MSVYSANNVIFDGVEQHWPSIGSLGSDSSRGAKSKQGLSPLTPSL